MLDNAEPKVASAKLADFGLARLVAGAPEIKRVTSQL